MDPNPWQQPRQDDAPDLPWWHGEDAAFWETFEDAFVSPVPHAQDHARNLVRSDVGRRLLTGLRPHIARTKSDDPVVLAQAAHRLSAR